LPSIARGTDGSNPSPSSGESYKPDRSNRFDGFACCGAGLIWDLKHRNSPPLDKVPHGCYPKQMAWFYILFADVFEVAWPFILKWTAPLSRWAPLFVVIICAIPANYLLAEAVKRLPAATVYATFVGIGTAGTAMVGMVFFRESTNLGRICSLVLILLGLIGLKVFSDAPG